MNLFAGLEKFGLKTAKDVDLYQEEKKEEEKERQQESAKPAEEHREEDFILEKTVRCPVCDKNFKTKMVKNGKARRLEPDDDLRPRHQFIDTLKYGVSSCPNCGYTAMNRYFEHITSGQIRLIQEQVCSNFKATEPDHVPVWNYDTAIQMYKLSLFVAMAKKSRTSEKAYNCLMISWLYRGKIEELSEDPLMDADVDELKQEEEDFYLEAYEGLVKAMGTENFPICGMDQCTLDYLLAYMAAHFKQYDVASKCLSRVLTSMNASRKMKDMALELKDEIIRKIKKK